MINIDSIVKLQKSFQSDPDDVRVAEIGDLTFDALDFDQRLPFSEMMEGFSTEIELMRPQTSADSAIEKALAGWTGDFGTPEGFAGFQQRVKFGTDDFPLSDSFESTGKIVIRKQSNRPPLPVALRPETLLAPFSRAAKEIEQFARAKPFAVIKPRHDVLQLNLKEKLSYLLGRSFSYDPAVTRVMAVALAACGVGASVVVTQPESISEKSVSVPIPEVTYCTPELPMTVNTPLGTFRETDNNMCKRISQALMAPHEGYRQYNEHIAVRALENGSFEFRLATFENEPETFDAMLKDHPRSSVFGKDKIRQAYKDTYRFKTGGSQENITYIFALVDRYIKAENAWRAYEPRQGQDKKSGFAKDQPKLSGDLALASNRHVQEALEFRKKYALDSFYTRPVSAVNYRAVVAGFMISPLPFSFYLANANMESGFDGSARNLQGTATGLYQITSATFLTMVKLYAKPLGLRELHADVMAISERHRHNDKITIHDPDYLAIFNRESRNPYYSAAFSVMNFISEISKTQADVDAGKIILPEGRKKLIEIDVRMLHFMRGNAKVLWRAIEDRPDAPLRDVLPSIYSQNADAFKNFTVREYYDHASRSHGFGKREIDVSQWSKETHGRPFSEKAETPEIVSGIGTKFRIVANNSTIHKIMTVQTFSNVPWVTSTYRGVGVEPIPARSPN